MSERALYLRAAESLRKNRGQWDAYNATGHCVVLAGPGSGKTKTLTIKMARMLSEDIQEPRGVACITYSNECARELEDRLETLGIEPGKRVFIGTVHSFSLTQIVLPYAKTAGIAIPEDFRVATRQEERAALQDAFRHVIGGPENPANWSLPMNRYRRSILKRDSETWRKSDPQLAALVERYEGELRKRRLIDFEDMPLLAVRALTENSWLRRAVLAKYPALVVDEYQDLGQPLHRMVLGLCFSAGVRLFAVGDADQSIYGFTGAYPELLQQLSRRSEVETVQLRFNYRSGTRIVAASEHALGEERGYRAREGAPEGAVYFHAAAGSYEQQADFLFQKLIPELTERIPDLELGHIAVLYPAAWIGDRVALAAAQYSVPIVRTDTNALYPRSSRMMRWVELCAQWCCTGWRNGDPKFSRVIGEGLRLFHEALRSNEDQIAFRRLVVEALWQRRDPNLQLHQWLKDIHEVVLQIGEGSRTLGDELQILSSFIDRTSPTGSSSGLSLGDLGSDPNGQGKLQLSTLHSSKGREFRIAILFGMDEGRIPRNNPGDGEVREARRLFYVGFTRAKEEVHLVYTPHSPSRFVREIKQRLEEP